MMDRFDLRIEVPQVSIEDLGLPATGESSASVAARVAAARALQAARFAGHATARVNADASGRLLEEIAPLDGECRSLLALAADRLGLTPRGYHRILRSARTIADLDGAADIRQPHLAEALSYRLPFGRRIDAFLRTGRSTGIAHAGASALPRQGGVSASAQQKIRIGTAGSFASGRWHGVAGRDRARRPPFAQMPVSPCRRPAAAPVNGPARPKASKAATQPGGDVPASPLQSRRGRVSSATSPGRTNHRGHDSPVPA